MDILSDETNLIKDKALTFEQFNLFFSIETCHYWGNLWNIISYTKAYSFGIEIALTLLKAYEKYSEHYSENERRKILILIYYQFLNMLDKADMWEDFLINWDLIFNKSIENKLFNAKYIESSREFHYSRGAKEYLISDVEGGFILSFLYGLSHRKKIIERKYNKLINKRKISNIRHEQQFDLTPSEIYERYKWLSDYLNTGVYDCDPPASKQKSRRRESKFKNIIVK